MPKMFKCDTEFNTKQMNLNFETNIKTMSFKTLKTC